MCISNNKQLMLAWRMYANDYNGNFVPNQPGAPGGWVTGWLDFNPNNPDNTNIMNLMKPETARLAPYTKSPSIYKCPADKSAVKRAGQVLPRIRSISMSQAVGPDLKGKDVDVDGWLPHPPYKIFVKDSDLNIHPPVNLWVLVDKHPDSINEAAHGVRMAKAMSETFMVDYPASFHNGACGFGFADGHAEIHKWLDPRSKPPPKYNNMLQLMVSQPNNPDIMWLVARTSSLEK
jgi:prepilin-type processing-associated H-X9-DG protein